MKNHPKVTATAKVTAKVIGGALSTISLSTERAPPLKKFLFIHTPIVSVSTCCYLHLSLVLFVVS